MWVRGQGAAVAKAVWFHKFYNLPKIEVSWSGMTEAEKEDLAMWLKERAQWVADRKRIDAEEYEKRNAKFAPKNEAKMGMLERYRSRMACRADCGEQNPNLCCSKCKITRKPCLLFFVMLLTSYRLLQRILSIGRLEGAFIYLHDSDFPLSGFSITKHTVERKTPFPKNIYAYFELHDVPGVSEWCSKKKVVIQHTYERGCNTPILNLYTTIRQFSVLRMKSPLSISS